MIVYRLTRAPYANDLSGKGGLVAANRCNEKGTRVIYTAEHVSLAHLNPVDIPTDYVLVTIDTGNRGYHP